MDDTRMMMQTKRDNISSPLLYFHSAMAINKDETILYCCSVNNSDDITHFDFIDNKWIKVKDLKPSRYNNNLQNNLINIF